MAIDPYKGGKCWSCKYCDDVGYYDEDRDTVYKRKCHYPGKEYLDYCTKYCSNYIWDGKDSSFNYTSRSVPSGSYYASSTSSSSSSSSSSSVSTSSADSSGCGKGCFITLIILAILIGGAYFLLTGNVSFEKKETTSQTSATSEKTAVINHTRTVNLREKASSKSEIIAVMSPGSTVTVFEEEQTKNWIMIEFEGHTGWCFKKYLTYED